jgi:hypothetical protein
MVTKLSNILRYSLQSGRTDTVLLETETRIPPMLLQTLVENGTKHGVARLPGGGEIRVGSQVEKRAVRVNRMLENQARFIAGVQKDIAAADRGELIDHDEACDQPPVDLKYWPFPKKVTPVTHLDTRPAILQN